MHYLLTDFTEYMDHTYRAYNANLDATKAMEKFVQEHKRWPTSWSEFESISAKMSPGEFRSADWTAIRALVVINFDLTLEDVANQPLDSFDAIEPIPPVRAGYRREYVPLLETVRSALDSGPEDDPSQEHGALSETVGHAPRA